MDKFFYAFFDFLKCDTYLDFVQKMKIMKWYLDFSEKYFSNFFEKLKKWIKFLRIF